MIEANIGRGQLWKTLIAQIIDHKEIKENQRRSKEREDQMKKKNNKDEEFELHMPICSSNRERPSNR